ncbi:hypothetical protein [Streptosporangium subroseum]|uniref:hypothetical protein n=1 Tax=Streptosporangium subroseum TaxID=106412 RepID=UPI0030847E10|nr:hypothetical protein OHB15_26875 [Streptosporangium subroseum]
MSLSAHRSRGQRLLLATLFVLGSLTAILPANPAMAKAPPEKPAQRGKIASELINRMKTARAGADDRVEAVVVLGAGPDLASAASSPSEARTTLAETARSAQAPVVQLIESRGDQVVNTFWLKNMVLVRVKPATMDALAALPMVDRVIPNFELKAPPTPPASPAASLRAAKAGASTWGVEKIGADRVQKERGLTGDGVRVAILPARLRHGRADAAGPPRSQRRRGPDHPRRHVVLRQALRRTSQHPLRRRPDRRVRRRRRGGAEERHPGHRHRRQDP